MYAEWLVVSIVLTGASGKCVSPSPLTLQMMLEYTKWRSWDQIVLFDDLSSKDCALDYAKPLIMCLGASGIRISIQSATNPKLPEALAIRRHRVTAVVLLDRLNLTSTDNVLQLASQKLLFNYYVSWLMITARNTNTVIDTVLRHLSIGIDSDVVVATSSLSGKETPRFARRYWNRTCWALREYTGIFEFQQQSERKRNDNATANLDYVTLENRTMSFYLVHVYKIRASDNSSLVVDPLGSWNPGLHALRHPISVKLRNNFHGLPIIVGILNGSSDGQSEVPDEEESNDILPLLDIITFVTHNINASMDQVPHEKLGTLTTKAWTNLLGDVVNGNVDIGLGYININDERQREMSFTHPLIRSMRNIYFHPPESGSMRDIFLRPFNNHLLLCVAMTCCLVVLAMGAINYANRITLSSEDEQIAGLGEAALWCISIMCMQGSPWNPNSRSGKTVVLASLIFALVIYNAYAGFITSILSVQATGIRSLSDLLRNNYKLGYSINDDEYIRNANDSNLRQLYIKAFNNRESRLETTQGLEKAVKGGYGFFVSATLARRALRTSLLHDRCSLKELVIPQTITVIALPMSVNCPYKKIINLSILRIKEGGVLNRISERMLPGMPRCEVLTTFHSARFADVYSAFVILVIGIVSAFTIGIFERIWNKRRFVQERLKRSILQAHRMRETRNAEGILTEERFGISNHQNYRQLVLPFLRSRSPRRNQSIDHSAVFGESRGELRLESGFFVPRSKSMKKGKQRIELSNPAASWRNVLRGSMSKSAKRKAGTGDGKVVPSANDHLPMFPFQQ